MPNNTNSIVQVILSVLFFPLYFQNAFVTFSWGAFDLEWVMVLKRLFLLLPALAIIAACWVTIAALLTVVFRYQRQRFFVALVVTWWDLGKSIVNYWGGIFRFLLVLVFTLLGALKILLLGAWAIIKDILFTPFRLLFQAGRNVVGSSVPWIAVFLTLFWTIIETTIFTYVTTPLVVDTFSNITGTTLAENAVRIPLFIFLFFIVLGSYAVLSAFIDKTKEKKLTSILGIGVIELVVLFVEVVFLYREFVDSLVPWFAQYSENFELGIFGTLAISCFVWFGVRSLSWFLFASYGTPTLLRIIQGQGVEMPKSQSGEKQKLLENSSSFMDEMKGSADWFKQQGEDFINALMVPPLQIVAAVINFIILLVTSRHLFEIPFNRIAEIKPSIELIDNAAGVYKEKSNPETVNEKKKQGARDDEK